MLAGPGRPASATSARRFRAKDPADVTLAPVNPGNVTLARTGSPGDAALAPVNPGNVRLAPWSPEAATLVG